MQKHLNAFFGKNDVNMVYKFLKRTFDLLVGIIALIVLSPVFLFTILGIEISDPGPIFYRAKRVGYRGKIFTMYKFRSMRKAKTESEKSEASFKADTDRIFRFGAFIRRTKIDELAQLFNLIGGSMSVVGPRPAAIDQVEIMREGKYAIANTVKPGITGPAAIYDYIYGDSIEDNDQYKELVLPTRRELEAYYPAHMGIGFDIKMMWYTFVCVVKISLKKKPQKILEKITAYVEPADKRTTDER